MYLAQFFAINLVNEALVTFLVSDSSALNQQRNNPVYVLGWFGLVSLFVTQLILLVDSLAELGGSDIPINSYDLVNRTRRCIQQFDTVLHRPYQPIKKFLS